MHRIRFSRNLHLALAAGLFAFGAAQAATSVSGQAIANNTPRFVATAKNLGPANPSEVIDVAIWLNPHNRAEMDSLVEELYDPSSSHYHDWLKVSDVASRFAPTAADIKTVEEFFSSHNLPVVAVGPLNFSVRARGAVADVEKAFHVSIGTFQVNGQTVRANTSDPYIDGAAAALTANVAGLDNLSYQHPLMARGLASSPSGKGVQSATVSSNASNSFFTSNCFTGVTTETFSTSGSYPIGTYTGNSYNGTQNPSGCGYTPAEIQTAYNLTGLYKEGFDGTGQTVVIIDWCGSPTIRQDANAFSARFGLPALTASSFKILYSYTTPTCAAPDPEINIDVEWAHAIAPGANIDLVVPPSATFMDVDDAELYALANGLGNVISGSYGSEELYTPTATLNEENLINEIAASLGVSADFATGDDGDYTFDFPQFDPASVIAPADSPYATAVGGVTLALKSNNAIAWQTGWGNNETLLVDAGTVYDPPINFGFYAGSGGGPSAVFSKPSFQNKLPGAARLLPDISWLADPFTGAIIAISENFVYPPLEWQVYGGTSLATPMFSGLWAIANQEAGAPLGQAARHLYSMPAGTITDVLPVNSSTNVTASINEGGGLINNYTAAEIAAPLENTTKFYSAIWNIPLEQDTAYVITFGTDSGLTITPGWDDVTGLGTPNGKAFADYFNPGKP
ncbi:MAG: S8/S53 family peptidase [Acidobacteriaceae bacterium]|nr:S8/S53 family peptidase [Acidobacteriaceae bacterium]